MPTIIYDDDSDADSDMTNPFAPDVEPLPVDEAVRLCPAFWGPKRWNEYYAAEDKDRRARNRLHKIRKWLGPVLIEGGLLREDGRIQRSLRLARTDTISAGRDLSKKRRSWKERRRKHTTKQGTKSPTYPQRKRRHRHA